MRGPVSKLLGLSAVVALGAVGACDRQATDPADSGLGELQINAAVNSPTIATLVVEVTAADLSDPLIFNFELVEGVATGTITVPAGGQRTITVRAFDVSGILTHEGEATVNIRPGPNPLLRITLRPLTGQQPIEVMLGSFTITVNPANALLRAGQTLQMEATVTDVDGTVVGSTADVLWATSQPAVATVDAAGLVTAHVHQGVFFALIVASFGGRAAAAGILVFTLEITSNAFEGARPAFDAFFSPPVASLPAGELAGEVVFVGRGCPAGSTGEGSPEDPYLADPAGKIALIERGACFFTLKVARAQSAGAIGVIIHNNVEAELLMAAGTADPIVIPAVGVSLSTGTLLRAGTPPVTVRIAPVGGGGVSAAELGTTDDVVTLVPRAYARGPMAIR